MKRILWCSLLLCAAATIGAQQIILESSSTKGPPLDGIADPSAFGRAPLLAYPLLREADILWEKRIWREIDVREKMNASFQGPVPLFDILRDAVLAGEIRAFSTIDDKFSTRLSVDEVQSLLATRDTIEVMDPETYEITYSIVENELSAAEILKYRLKEVWFFDTRHSTMRVRILGVAPIRYVYDQAGSFLFEQPLFWIYYPESRSMLARHNCFNEWNEADRMSWEDRLEMRFFASFITKELNVHDRRLEDYLAGRELLLESHRIKEEIFNYEHDLWSY